MEHPIAMRIWVAVKVELVKYEQLLAKTYLWRIKMNFSTFRRKQSGDSVHTSVFKNLQKAGFDKNDHFITLCSGADSERLFVAITSKGNK